MIRYAVADYNEHQREIAYRIYVTDTLQILSENTAKQVSEGKYTTKRYADILAQNTKKNDNRTAAEVIDTMKQKLSVFGNGDDE